MEKEKKITNTENNRNESKYFGGKKRQSQNNTYYDPIYVKF